MPDLWVQSFEGDPADAVRNLQAAFGLDEETARGIVDSVPCVVKRGVEPVEAMPWVRALREMGARVELRDEALRQDPRASLRMPRARFGRKSLRPSDKGSKRPELSPEGATISNPSSNLDESAKSSELAELPGSDVLDEVMGDVLAEVAKPKLVPARPAAPVTGATRESDPFRFLSSAVVMSSSGSVARSHDAGPAVFGPPEGATPRRVQAAPQAPADDEDDEGGDLSLDVSGELDLGLQEPLAPMRAPGSAPAPEATPNAAQDGHGFGEDPLEPPIPEGLVELEVVEPPPAPERSRVSAPPAVLSGPHAAVFDEREDEIAADAKRRREQWKHGAWILGGGAGVLAATLVAGISCFTGGVALPWLILDAVAFVGLALGGATLVGAIRGRSFELGSLQLLGTLVVSFGLALGINFLNAPTPEEARLREVVEFDEETEEAIEAGRYTEARAWAESRSASPSVVRLIDALYTAGARRVYAGGAGDFIVEMPELQATRGSIERAYRRFLGYRLNQVDASLHPATRYWRIVVVFAD